MYLVSPSVPPVLFGSLDHGADVFDLAVAVEAATGGEHETPAFAGGIDQMAAAGGSTSAAPTRAAGQASFAARLCQFRRILQ